MRIGFSYGALCDDLETQANKQGFTFGGEVEKVERFRNSFNMLAIHGIISDGQKENIIKKLHQKVCKDLQPLKEDKP